MEDPEKTANRIKNVPDTSSTSENASNDKTIVSSTPQSLEKAECPPQSAFLRLRLRAWCVISYVPKRCRHDPARPKRFSLALNLLFGFAGTFTVANLYYSHPILNKLAEDFHISNERASLVPTLAQFGYLGGLILLCPLGDLLPRRPLVLGLVWFTATVWIGLCVTHSFSVFLFLTYLTAFTTVTPQLMLPLVAELAPPNRRATALSIVVSGLALGLLLARVLSGVVTNFTHWRNIYFLSFGLQYLVLILLYFSLPDYPSTNPVRGAGSINYFRALYSIIQLYPKHPLLIQACLIGLLTSATFTSFWTTLTFLLSSPPYSYTPLTIGLFAFIGVTAMIFAPVVSRLLIDRLPSTLYSVILGELINLLGIALGTYTGTHTVAGPVLQAFLLDLGLCCSQIANRSAIYGIEPKARNRVNTAYMVAVFVGQLVGTAAGNKVYAIRGWVGSGSLSVGLIVAALVVCVIRGPREKGWVGWGGGWPRFRRVDNEGLEGEEHPEGQEENVKAASSTNEKGEKDVEVG